jgi:hypothetical protein
MKVIVIKWSDTDFDDLLPTWIGRHDLETDYFVHEVRGPKGGIHYARCSVRVRGKKTELNYDGQHRKYNEERGNLIGVLTLTPTATGEKPDAFWVERGGNEPGDVRFEII